MLWFKSWLENKGIEIWDIVMQLYPSVFAPADYTLNSFLMQVHEDAVLLCDFYDIGIPEAVQVGLRDADILVSQ